MNILRFLQVLHETREFVLNSKSFSLLIFFFLGTTSIAYLKVFRMRSQQYGQVQANARSLNYGQPAITLQV